MSVRLSLRRVLPLVGAAACWGVGTVVTKQVLAGVAPLTLLPIQLAASCVFLVVVSRIGRSRIRWSASVRRLTALGVLNPGLAYAIGLVGLTSISASMSVLLWATEPVLVMLLAAALLRERIPVLVGSAMAVAVAGVVLVVYRPGAAGAGVGIGLTLSAVAACALYTVLTRRLILDDASVSVVLLQQLAALGFALVVGAVVQGMSGGGWDLASLTVVEWLGAAGSGVVYYGLAFWLFLIGLRHSPASLAGAFITLVPVFGVVAGYLAGERLTAVQWAGAGVVVGAIAVIAVGPADTEPTGAAPAGRSIDRP